MDLQGQANVEIDNEYAPTLFKERIEAVLAQPSDQYISPRDKRLAPYAARTLDSLKNILPEWRKALEEFRIDDSYNFKHGFNIKLIDSTSSPTWRGETTFNNITVSTLIKGHSLLYVIEGWETSSTMLPDVEAFMQIDKSEYYIALGAGAFMSDSTLNSLDGGGEAPNYVLFLHAQSEYILDGVPLPAGSSIRNRAAMIENAGNCMFKNIKFSKTTQGGEHTLTRGANLMRHRFLPQEKLDRLTNEFMGSEEVEMRMFSSGFSSTRQTGGADFIGMAMGHESLGKQDIERVHRHMGSAINNGTHTVVDEDECYLRREVAKGGACAPKEKSNDVTIASLIMVTETYHPYHHAAGFSYVNKNQHMRVSLTSREEILREWPSNVELRTEFTVRIAENGTYYPLMHYTHTAPIKMESSKIVGGQLRKTTQNTSCVVFDYYTSVFVAYSHTIDPTYEDIHSQKEFSNTSKTITNNDTGDGVQCPEHLTRLRQCSETVDSYLTSGCWYESGQMILIPLVKKKSYSIPVTGPYSFVNGKSLLTNIASGEPLNTHLFPTGQMDIKKNKVMSAMVNVMTPKLYCMSERVVGFRWTSRAIATGMSVKVNSTVLQGGTDAMVPAMTFLLNPDFLNKLAKHTYSTMFDHRGGAPRQGVAPSGPHMPKIHSLTTNFEFNPYLRVLLTPFVLDSFIMSKNYTETTPSTSHLLFG